MRITHCARLAVLSCCLLPAPGIPAAESRTADTQADARAMEDACRQAAVADGVAVREMDDYMEDCLSEAMQNLDDDASPDAEGGARRPGGGDEDQAPEGDQEPAPVD
jgi:hypothetical protein